MSTAFAIGAVTSLLQSTLTDWLETSDLTRSLNGARPTVTALPPSRVLLHGDEKDQLNLFLYQVLPNAGWRNVGLPARSHEGALIANAPLALDLFYLLTAYAHGELDAEVLLGHAMLRLHDSPGFNRAALRGRAGKDEPRLLRDSALAEQVEAITIAPHTLSLDEMSKLWSALQAPYRPTVAYQVSVVLLQSERPARATLPVLHIGADDRGPSVRPSLEAPYPTIEKLEPPGHQTSLGPDEELRIVGHHFAGDDGEPAHARVTVRLVPADGRGPITFDVPPTSRTTSVIRLRPFNAVPIDDEQYVTPGLYRLSLEVTPDDNANEARATNELPLLVAPRIVAVGGQDLSRELPPRLDRININGERGDLDDLSVTCEPGVRTGQRAALILGNREVVAAQRGAAGNELRFNLRGCTAGVYLVRLRIDGVESELIDRSDPQRPQFDQRQRVEVR